MARKLLHLHKVQVPVKSYIGAKKYTVPNQAMTLHEILKRFIRRESLPISHEGLYDTRFGDLEKMQNLDITEKMEHIAKIKLFVKKGEELEELKRAKGEEDKTPPPPPPPPLEPPTTPKA